MKIANILINNKFDKYRLNDYGQSVLHVACSYNNVDLIDFLVKNNHTIDTRLLNGTTRGEKQTPFHYSCRYNSFDAVKYIIQTYSNSNEVEWKKMLEAKDFQERTPFYLAAEYGKNY